MKHSTAEFEKALIQMGVDIDSITKAQNHVIKVLGHIHGELFKWDALGSCFSGHVRVPEYDIRFVDISSDNRTVTVAGTIHYKVRRRFWHPSFICKKCSLRKDCNNTEKLYVCCTDQFDGFFKLIRP